MKELCVYIPYIALHCVPRRIFLSSTFNWMRHCCWRWCCHNALFSFGRVRQAIIAFDYLVLNSRMGLTIYIYFLFLWMLLSNCYRLFFTLVRHSDGCRYSRSAVSVAWRRQTMLSSWMLLLLLLLPAGVRKRLSSFAFCQQSGSSFVVFVCPAHNNRRKNEMNGRQSREKRKFVNSDRLLCLLIPIFFFFGAGEWQ